MTGLCWNSHKGIKAEVVFALFALPALGVLVKVLQNTSQVLSPEEFPPGRFAVPFPVDVCVRLAWQSAPRAGAPCGCHMPGSGLV